jgi:hypothetical protein
MRSLAEFLSGGTEIGEFANRHCADTELKRLDEGGLPAHCLARMIVRE